MLSKLENSTMKSLENAWKWQTLMGKAESMSLIAPTSWINSGLIIKMESSLINNQIGVPLLILTVLIP